MMRSRTEKREQLHTQQGLLLLYFFSALLISLFFWGKIEFNDKHVPFIPKPVYDTSAAFEKIKPLASSEVSPDGTVRL